MQFTLRSIFATVTVVVVVLTLLMYFTKEYRHQLAIRSPNDWRVFRPLWTRRFNPLQMSQKFLQRT